VAVGGWEVLARMCGACACAEHEEVEAIILLQNQAAVEVFKQKEGVLEGQRTHDSASSLNNSLSPQLKAYGMENDIVFDMPLTGGSLSCMQGQGGMINLMSCEQVGISPVTAGLKASLKRQAAVSWCESVLTDG
jgi:hypothetical protein